jgi:hypothetical protein
MISVIWHVFATGALLSAMFCIAQPDMDFIHLIGTAGLGGALAVLLVRWIIGQYSRIAERLTFLEDQKTELIKESTAALLKAANEIARLTEELHKKSK